MKRASITLLLSIALSACQETPPLAPASMHEITYVAKVNAAVTLTYGIDGISDTMLLSGGQEFRRDTVIHSGNCVWMQIDECDRITVMKILVDGRVQASEGMNHSDIKGCRRIQVVLSWPRE